MRICGQNQPSGTEFIEIRVSLPGVECCDVLLVCFANFIKKLADDELLSTDYQVLLALLSFLL